MITATLKKIQKENEQVQTFWFKPAQSLRYTAGQFIELYLPHDMPDDRGIKRWFTLSSSPSDELLSITTKYAGPKSSSFKKQLFSLKPGATFQIVEPMGDFVLPKDLSIPLVFVAGGIGVTPFHSMVSYLAASGEQRKIQILLAANQASDILFEKLFRDYGADVTLIVSEPSPGWKGEVGRLTAEKILSLTGAPTHKRIYASGPEPMVETLEKDLLSSGVKRTQLVSDFFPGYSANLT